MTDVYRSGKIVRDYEEEYGDIPDPTLHEVGEVRDYKGMEFG
jgi:hypothetical protein